MERPWVRWELELKDERANGASRILASGMRLGDVVIGILANYVRFIVKDNDRKTRCSTLPKWEMFIAGVAGLTLYQRSEPVSIEKKKDWLLRQIAPTLSAVVLADGGDTAFLYDLLANGRNRINKPTRLAIRAYQMNPLSVYRKGA